MDSSSKKRFRRNWGHTETLKLLESYKQSKDQFECPRKKRSAYQHLLDDLIRKRVLEEPTTTDMLEQRMKTLIRAYKTIQNNENCSGASPCVVPFMQQMHEIFGTDRKMGPSNNKRSRRNWGRAETLQLLESYRQRREEFECSRKKRFAYQHLLDDLEYQGVLEEPTTADMLEQRMKTLLRAYRTSRDDESRSGVAPCVAPFMQQMDEIFGSDRKVDTSNNKRSRRNWGREETLQLLEGYMQRKEQFDCSRKKKFAYQHLLEDLECKGVLEEPTTSDMLEQRMKTLFRAYKTSRDNESYTGAASCAAPFMKEMDEIFGNRELSDHHHMLDLSCEVILTLSEESPTTHESIEEESLTSSSHPQKADEKEDSSEINVDKNTSKEAPVTTIEKQKKTRRKKIKRQSEMLDFLKKAEEANERRHQEKMSFQRYRRWPGQLKSSPLCGRADGGQWPMARNRPYCQKRAAIGWRPMPSTAIHRHAMAHCTAANNKYGQRIEIDRLLYGRCLCCQSVSASGKLFTNI